MAGFSDKIFRWLGYGRYSSTLPTAVNGEVVEVQCDQRGRMLVSLDGSGSELLYRNLLEPTVLLWDHDNSGFATVDSIKGNYEESLGVKFNITVGPTGSDETQEITVSTATLSGIVATIEAAFTTPNVASEYAGNLRIKNASRVVISAAGASEALKQASFMAVGLPDTTRDRAGRMASPAETTDVQPTASIFDRKDVWSLPVEIPEGCNRVTIDYEIDYRATAGTTHQQRSCLVHLLPHFGNDADDRPTCLFDAKIPDRIEDGMARVDIAIPTPDAWLGNLRAMKAIATIGVYEMTQGDAGLRFKGTVEWDVPAGKTHFCLGALYGRSESTESQVTSDSDKWEIRQPPVLKATIMGGAR